MRARLLSVSMCAIVTGLMELSGVESVQISQKRLNLPQFIVIFEFAKMTMTGFTSFYLIFFMVCRFCHCRRRHRRRRRCLL